MLELRYGVISREKRARLQAGKGVKKNGMYLQNNAASFESLPPGPDPKSVAKDIHEYLPKLTKRGTLFRPSQSTIEQRQREFVALIEAFFEEDVPALIQELRDDRIIRDFFGIWRRDHDLTLKKKGKRSKPSPSVDTSNRVLSSYFSASNISLSLPPTPYSDVPASPSLPQVPRSVSSRRRVHTAASMVSLSDTESAFTSVPFTRSPPSSAPPFMGATLRDGTSSEDERTISRRKMSNASSNISSFSGSSFPDPSSSIYSISSSIVAPTSIASTSRPRSNSRSTNPSTSPRSETFNVSSDFPLFLSSSTRDMLPSSRQAPYSPTYPPPLLGTLPEDAELHAPVSALPPPTPRSRKNSSTKAADRANRNCIVFHDTDELSSGEGDVLDPELLIPIEGAAHTTTTVSNSNSSSSRPSSIALSSLSLQSRRSSWRTSVELGRPSSAGSGASPLDLDFPFVPGTESFAKHERPSSPPPVASNALRRGHSGRRARSMSQPQPYPLPEADEHGSDAEGGWADLGEDFMDTYFGSAEPILHVEDPAPDAPGLPSDVPLDEHDDADAPDSPLLLGAALPSPRRQEISYPAGGRPSAFHLPWPASPPPSPQPPSRVPAFAAAALESPAADDALVIKAALDDAIVVFRTQRDVSLAELRRRVHDKFTRAEGLPLPTAFALAYVPPAAAAAGAGGKRASTISAASAGSADWARAVPVWREDEWATARASCGAKITLRVSYPA
ncbi:hypothetical protein BC834DRAFT_911578 [Gloeopeniophorella convolvens]|nr:hypothetical protein BC834DRAFT_911578 [Gloeopeniophorella convolvens]